MAVKTTDLTPADALTTGKSRRRGGATSAGFGGGGNGVAKRRFDAAAADADAASVIESEILQPNTSSPSMRSKALKFGKVHPLHAVDNGRSWWIIWTQKKTGSKPIRYSGNGWNRTLPTVSNGRRTGT